MKNLYYIILLLLLPLFQYGQVEIPVQINWNGISTQSTVKGLEVKTISFDNNIHKYRFGALPVYTTNVSLPAEYFGCELDFKVISADTLTVNESISLTDSDLLEGEILWYVEYDDLMAKIYVVPMMRIQQEEKIQIIQKFEISVDFVPIEERENIKSREVFYTDNSVLSSGDWYKIGIVQSGIHKITYSDLQSIGIDPSGLDLTKIGIFGTYDGMLNELNSVSRPDDLTEDAIMIMGEDDSLFDENDYILFSAKSAVTWKYNAFSSRFDHKNNIYTDTTYYFLTTTEGTGKRIAVIPGSGPQPTYTVDEFSDYDVHDKDLENLIYSGKEWFGERFSGDTLERTFSFHFPNKFDESPVYLNFEIIGRSFTNAYYQVYANETLLIDSTLLLKVSSSGGIYARRSSKTVTFFTEEDQIDIKVKFLTDDVTARAWLSYIELNVVRDLKYDGGQMNFRDPLSAAAGNVTRFNIRDASSDVMIWDITDHHNPLNIDYIQDIDYMYYVVPTDSLREFIIAGQETFHSPVSYEMVQNQNLHNISSVDMIIISYASFLGQANRLANIHESVDGMNVLVVTPDLIYNEFSSGSQDVSAIRDFMRMLYERGSFSADYKSGYLLLFGDASFDYKHRIHENTNFVPTYESKESLRLTGSFATDDFFGLLDEDEGGNSSGELDIGIGRFPVTTVEEAETAVDKIEQYVSRNFEVMRDWRNQFCFIADDGDNNLHLHQAKQLINIADTLHPGMRINKIFSDAFIKTTVPGGKRFAEVNILINKQVESGTLIINYTGHGGLIGWSEEMILDLPMIHGFANFNNLPLFITATCEFSRFDDPEFTSAGEYVFLNEHGGGIALLTTTRLAYAHANIVVNRRIYEHILEKVNGELPRLGDLVKLSKIPSDQNYLNFVLLGDPALRLAYPKYEVQTTLINSKPVTNDADTVRALQEVTVHGKIIYGNGSLIDSFTGFIYPKVFDKPSNYSTLGNDNGSYPEEFQLIDRLLFDGKISVNNGHFEFSFLVPKDISYNYGFGTISYYALDTMNMVDAWGAYEKLLIGGYDESAHIDDNGPVINLYLEDKTFVSGDATSKNPLMLAEISDEQGISYTGYSLGRDIVVVIDNDYANSMIMNEYFNISTDSYQSGSIAYQLERLEPGLHTLSLKAWDLHNNSSEATIDFYVDENADIELSGVLNYPNPFTETTKFDFIHNKSNAWLEVEINIYDINGRFVTSINEQVKTFGFRIIPIQWNGRDDNGNRIAPGVYMYHIIVTDQYGSSALQSQKFIKIN